MCHISKYLHLFRNLLSKYQIIYKYYTIGGIWKYSFVLCVCVFILTVFCQSILSKYSKVVLDRFRLIGNVLVIEGLLFYLEAWTKIKENIFKNINSLLSLILVHASRHSKSPRITKKFPINLKRSNTTFEYFYKMD